MKHARSVQVVRRDKETCSCNLCIIFIIIDKYQATFDGVPNFVAKPDYRSIAASIVEKLLTGPGRASSS